MIGGIGRKIGLPIAIGQTMSSASLHHHYRAYNDSCAYCGKEWRRINDRYCRSIEEVVDNLVTEAKEYQSQIVEGALDIIDGRAKSMVWRLGI